MRIVPVIDVMHGQVVRGVAGRREEYRPIASRLTISTAPCAVAVALRAHFGLDTFYVADLDAIAGAAPVLGLYGALSEMGFRLWVDAGLREAADAAPLHAAGADTIVAGLETLAGPEALAGLLEQCGPTRIVLSLDLKAGQPLGATSRWRTNDPLAIAERAVALGVCRLLALDLTCVGVGQGVGTEALCRALCGRHPGVEITTGGGVRDIEDLRRLGAVGVDYALVASALHDGRITPAEILSLR